MKTLAKETSQTLESILDSFEDYVNRVGVDELDLQQFVQDWQASENAQLDQAAYLELLRVWMEYSFQAGNVVSVENAIEQFPAVAFDEASRNILEFERRRLESTWSASAGPSQELRTSLPSAPTEWEDFTLIAELGEGAFARVYLARQRSMANRLVALKITSRHTRESHWLARLQHSAVVPIYSVHQWGSLFGVCMPYLGNTTLADLLVEQRSLNRRASTTQQSDSELLTADAPSTLIADGKSLLTCLRQRQSQLDTVMRKAQTTVTDPSDAVEGNEQRRATTEVQERTSTARELSKLNYVESVAWIGSQLANALEHAHRLGVVHCDIKPANVLLAADGQPRLLDFNVAQEPQLLRQPSVVNQSSEGEQAAQMLIGGTPGYMAPEQVRMLKGDDNYVLDGRADVYALGAVLYEMLAGRRPETAEMPGERQRWLREKLRAANTKVTPALATIIVKCLAYDRSERYQTATELYEDLNAHVHHRPLVHQREPSLIERLHKWRRRHPSATSVGSISSLAAVLVLVMLGWVFRLQDSKRLLAVELDQKALVAELDQALPRVSAAREYTELLDEVQLDAERIAQILRRLVPQPATVKTLSEHIPAKTQLQLVTYAQLFRLSSQAELPTELASLQSVSQNGVELPQLYQAYLDGNPVGVVESYRDGGDLVEGDFASWLFLGHSFMQLEQWTDASEAYTYALAIKPELAIARFYRGISRMKGERWQEAAEDFSAVKRLQPSLMEARFNLAQVEKQLGKPKQAEAELSEAIDLGWKSVIGYYTRASLRKRLGDIDGAKADYGLALSLPPTSEADWLQLAGLSLRNEPEKAERYYRETIRRFPNSRIARQNLAHVLSESLQRPEEAIDVLTDLISMAKPLPEYFSGRAVLYAREQQGDAALADLRSAEQLHPVAPLVQYQIACGYSLLSGLDEIDNKPALEKAALRWYAVAVKAEPQLSQLAGDDPDLQWLRSQEAYKNIQQALMAIDVAVENE